MTEPAKKRTPAKKAGAKKAAAKKGAPAKKSSATKKSAASTKQTSAKKPAAVKEAAPARRGETRARDRAAAAVDSKFFKRAMDRARRISDDPAKLRDIADKANDSSALRSGPLAAVLDDLQALIRLVVAYARGLYRQIPSDRLVVVAPDSSTSSLLST